MDLEHESRLTKVETQCESNTRRITDLETQQKNLEELTSSVAALATREERVEKDVKEIKGDVKALAEKPAKRWDSFIETVFSIIITAVLAFLLGKFGL